MQVVGIIAEYNPLHFGHAYHIGYARRLAAADACVCVLSSNFVQRGEPALVSKWARTKMALASGVDLVVELPSIFSSGSAEYFASGSISILENLGIVDSLCFGSEAGKIEPLDAAANHLAFESEAFKELLKRGLEEGLSFAVSRQNALEVILKDSKNILGLINKSNNILGIEYIKALKRMGSQIRPLTIKRKGQNYNDFIFRASDHSFSIQGVENLKTRTEHVQDFSSATAIRNYIRQMKKPRSCERDLFLRNNIPESSLKIIADEFKSGRGPVFSEAFENTILHLFRCMDSVSLYSLPYIESGLENRLKRASIESVTFEEFVAKVVTKRYPISRIKRIIFSALLGGTGGFLEDLKDKGYAQYIRVLGFNDTGRRLLAAMKKKATLPIIIKPALYTKLENELARELFLHEIQASNAYVLGYPNINQRIGNSELTTSPIYLPGEA